MSRYSAAQAPGGVRDLGEVERLLAVALYSEQSRRIWRSGLLTATVNGAVRMAIASEGQTTTAVRAIGDHLDKWQRLIASCDGELPERACSELACLVLAVRLLVDRERGFSHGGMLYVVWLPLQAIGVANSPREIRALRAAPHNSLNRDLDKAKQLTQKRAWSELADHTARAAARALVLALERRERDTTTGGYARVDTDA